MLQNITLVIKYSCISRLQGFQLIMILKNDRLLILDYCKVDYGSFFKQMNMLIKWVVNCVRNVGIIKRFCVFQNNNVFLHDKISGLCVRRRIESIQECVKWSTLGEKYQRHGKRHFVSPNRDASIATRQIYSLILLA